MLVVQEGSYFVAFLLLVFGFMVCSVSCSRPYVVGVNWSVSADRLKLFSYYKYL